MSGVISAIITGGLALIGVVVTNWSNNRKVTHALDKAQSVTECKIEELTREVREHNNFARRMPVVEEQIKTISRRLDDLERKVNK